MFLSLYSFLRWCPGGLGIFLRQKIYPSFLGSCGKKILIGRFVTINNPQKISLGNNVIINDKVVLDPTESSLKLNPVIVLEDQTFIGTGSRLQTSSGTITIRTGCSIGSFCDFQATGTIIIEEQTLLAAFCRIGHPPTTTQSKESITIESGCWLGVRSIIMPGVTVGTGSIIGAHAVVEESLPANIVAVGTPAKVLRNRFEEQADP